MNIDAHTANRLKVARVKCDKSLLFFTKFFFKELRGSKFLSNWHHEEILEALGSISNYEYELLNINIPPRCSKTELVLNLIAESLGVNPSGNFLYITASDELRNEVSVRIRDIITHPFFRYMYDVRMKVDQNSKNLWRTEQGGGLKTATIFGQITGFGAGQMSDSNNLVDYVRNFEGCIILDDINKIDDAETLSANNKKVVRVLFNTIMSRKNSSDTPIINIQQRSGVEDASAMLVDYYESTKSSHKVMNLVYPAIIDGKSIWEKQLTIESLIQKRDSPLTSKMFRTQYMQYPVPESGDLFKKEWFEIVDESELPDNYNCDAYLDGAYTENTKNDPTGIMPCYYDRHKKTLYITGWVAKYMEMPELLEYIPNFAREFNITRRNKISIEPKASGKSLHQMLKKTAINAVEIKGKHISEGKMARAKASSATCASGKVKLIKGHWNDVFLSELCAFPNEKHDEAVDDLCYAIFDYFIKPVSIW